MANHSLATSKAIFGGILVVSVLFFAAPTTVAQAPARPDRGIMPTGSYSLSDIENINMTNGNVNLSIPLASLPPIAGGKLSLVWRAFYNSKLFNITTSEVAPNPPLQGYNLSQVDLSNLGGWSLGFAYRIETHNWWEDHQAILPTDPNDPETTLLRQYVWKIVLITPDGASHELRPVDNTLYPPYPGQRDFARGYYKDTPANIGGSMRYYSFDGSYLFATIKADSFPLKWDAFLPDGTQIKNRPGIQQIFDTNGNSISITTTTVGNVSTAHYVDDRTGREISYSVETPPNQHPSSGQVKYKAVGGVDVTTNVNYGTTHIQGWIYPNGDPCTSKILLDFEIDVVTSIVLPPTEPNVTRQFMFHYNSDILDPVNIPAEFTQCGAGHNAIGPTASHGYGELCQIDAPDGAIVKYKYLYEREGSYQGPYIDAKDITRNSIKQKTVEHDGVIDSWSYNIWFTSGSVSGPDGSVTTEEFYTHDPAFSSYSGSDKAGLVYRTTRSGKEVIERRWSNLVFSGGDISAPGGLAQFNPVLTQEYTTLMDSAGNPATMSAKMMEHDYNGNLVSTTEYDWIDLTQVTVPRDAQGVPTSFPGNTVLRTITSSFYNPATSPSATNYAKRNLTTITPLIVNAPSLTTVGPNQTEFHYDGLDNTAPSKGNLTKARQFVEGTTWIQTTHTYDPVTGNLASTTDPNLNVAQFFYDATKALPSSVVVDPLNGTGQQTTSTVYDFSTGLPLSVTDPNGRSTSTVYTNQLLGTVDPFGRPGVVTDPQGRTTVTRYRDNARQVEVWCDLNSPNDAKLRSRTSADQLGRPIKTESSEDGATYNIFADTVYQQMGRVTITTNPMRSESTSADGWTRATKDDLGRVVTVETFSGRYPSGTSTGVVSTSYNANATTVTDQAGKKRRSVIDGLGRLRRLDEPDPNGNLDDTANPPQPLQSTSYIYDELGNLTQVQQGSQQRIFTYDGLSRLKTAKNPEQVNTSGQMLATTYAYENNGNLQTKTDPRGVITTFTYDGLNRVTTRTYSGAAPGPTTPEVTYVYDTMGAALNGKGRLTSVSSSVSTYAYGSYDVMGRVLSGTQTTDGQNYSMSYQYNLAGGMTSETYPSGRQVLTEYDSAGRVAGVRAGALYYAGATATDFVNRIQYAAHGAISVMKMGNGKWEHTNFNNRLQPTQIGLGTSGADSSTLRLDYTYFTGNNGNVQTQRIVVTGSLDVTQTYTYDALNRLASASEGTAWRQNYDYDRYGNHAVNPSSTLIPNPSLTPQSLNNFSTTTNRITLGGFAYDFAGNLTSDPTTTPNPQNGMLYDAENRQTSYTKAGATTSYSYDGDGHRVKRVAGGVTTIFVYNAGGQLIAEYDNSTSPPAPGGTSYLTTDHLGSTRVVTKSDGTVRARYDYLPFGEEIPSTIGGRGGVAGYGGADSTKQKFTQKERDSESGLDYFLARYYSSAQGRFTSADAPLVGQHRRDPQSWNLYAYARNNPIIYIDPTGEDYALYEYDKDGKLINTYQIRDIADLGKGRYKGYNVYGQGENGDLYVSGPDGRKFTARYVPGDEGGVSVQAQYEISAVAEHVGFEMNRRAQVSQDVIVVGSLPIAIPAFISVSLSGGAIITLGISGGPVTAATQGAIINWGTGQSVAAVLQTQQVTASLTAERVAAMVARGLDKEWVTDQLIKYTASIAAGKLQNTQLLPRKELMEKLLTLWPK